MYGNEKRSHLISLTAAFVALIAVGGWVSLPIPPVPVTLQTFFVLLAAVVMGRYAVLPVFVYLLLGILNMPVFHNGLAGIGVLMGATGGYLIGFLPAVLVAGFAYEQENRIIRAGGITAATLIIYLFGITWMSYSTGMALTQAVLLGVVPFIAGDALKGIATYIIGERI
ncbi:biotin transporter BioY [Methanogenium organophilum]|uniref:Biotin transporter BioY n=1 Tax=Methanogenium organophilum TaxID=2199 RepID=A0A9X9T8K4_METOG|nr:biotin transporter BioY [Methanogenium organophilum]WAI01541.1 biotin transporter BioY [Methanogenium organophilum]